MFESDLPPMLPPEMLRPARQASVLFFVLAGLFFLGSALFFMSASVPITDWPPDKRDQILDVASRAGISAHQLMMIPGVTLLILSLMLGGLGLMVRRGGRAAVIIGMVVDALLLLAISGMMISSMGDPAAAMPSVIIAGAIAAVMVMLMRRLIGAERAARIAAAQAAYYYAQQWQAMQRPFEPGSGYGQGMPSDPQQTRSDETNQ
jgi:hypothetical protein